MLDEGMTDQKGRKALIWVFDCLLNVKALLELVISVKQLLIDSQTRLRSARNKNAVSRNLESLSNLDQVPNNQLTAFDIFYFFAVSVNWNQCNFRFLRKFSQSAFLLMLDEVLGHKDHDYNNKNRQTLPNTHTPTILCHRQNGRYQSCDQ